MTTAWRSASCVSASSRPDGRQVGRRYHRPCHEVTIRVTIRVDALPSLTQLVKEAASPAANGEPGDVRSHVLGAPGKAPTSWEQLTGARQLVVETRSPLPGQPRSQLP